MGSRTWIKIYCSKWLGGTLRQETSDVRGVWIDLLVLAGSGQYGDTGEIKLTNGIGFTDPQIATILNIKISLWKKAKARFMETERIKVSPNRTIVIINWLKYQSEYDRQQPYRVAKSTTPTPEPKFPLTTLQEKEKEKESKKLRVIVTDDSYNVSHRDMDEGNGGKGVSYQGKNGGTGGVAISESLFQKRVTLPSQINDYLRQHGQSSAMDICIGIGLSKGQVGSVSQTINRLKGKVYIHIEPHLWKLKEAGNQASQG